MTDWKKAFKKWEKETKNQDLTLKGHEEFETSDMRLASSFVFRNLYENQILPMKETLEYYADSEDKFFESFTSPSFNETFGEEARKCLKEVFSD